VSKDRSDEAFEILVKYHAEGNRDDAFVQAEFAEIHDTIRLEVESSKRSWLELLKTRANRKRAFIAACVGLFSQWSGNGLVSYFLAKVLATVGITQPHKQNEINLGLSCWNFVTAMTACFAVKYFNRRTMYLYSYIGMLITFACWTGASADFANTGNHHAAIAVVAMIFIYYSFYNTMMPLTYTFITEVFPFHHRAKGIAITQTFSRAGSAFNQFVNPIGLANISWKYYIVYVAWLAVELTIIYFVYPETKGPTLEELAFLFEGKDAMVGGQDRSILAEKGQIDSEHLEVSPR